WYLGILTNKSLVSGRMEEIRLLVDFVKSKATGTQKISLIATGTLCADALQASMIDADMFERKIFLEPLVSFRSLVTGFEYRPKYVMSSVAGGLKHYDLPQLLAVQRAQSTLVIGPVAGDGRALGAEEINK